MKLGAGLSGETSELPKSSVTLRRLSSWPTSPQVSDLWVSVCISACPYRWEAFKSSLISLKLQCYIVQSSKIWSQSVIYLHVVTWRLTMIALLSWGCQGTLHLWSPMLADRDRQDEGTNARSNKLGEKIAIKWEEDWAGPQCSLPPEHFILCSQLYSPTFDSGFSCFVHQPSVWEPWLPEQIQAPSLSSPFFPSVNT